MSLYPTTYDPTPEVPAPRTPFDIEDYNMKSSDKSVDVGGVCKDDGLGGPYTPSTPQSKKKWKSQTKWDYRITDENWYKTLPYAFRYYDRNGGKYSIYLPINPNNIMVVTHFATNVIATMYGTIEEHSEQRYFDIEITGTTGIAPRYLNSYYSEANKNNAKYQNQRHTFSTFKAGALGGLFAKTVGKANNIKNQASDLLGMTPENETGILTNQTGYTAFHRLYKFFLNYKKEIIKSSGTNKRPLEFINYKDNNLYKCSIQRFTLKRSASDPMLYNYSIVLRAYDLSEIGNFEAGIDIDQRKKNLGLDGATDISMLGKVKQKISGAKGIFGAAAGGINTLGR